MMGTLHEEVCTFTMISQEFFLELKMFQTKFAEEIKSKHILGRGADKSLDRHNSQCRRTEQIVSLERGVCSRAELQVFSSYRGSKETCQATRTISTTSRRER
jgi:hypothetical protein